MPDYSIPSLQNESLQFLILPYLKNYIVVFLIIGYLFKSLILNVPILLIKKSDFLFKLLLIIFFIYLIYILIFDTVILENPDPLSITSIILPIFLFLILYHNYNLDVILNYFLKMCSYAVLFMAFELAIYFFYPNPYSFSDYNGAFISILFQNLQIVSVISNLVFAISFINVLSKNKIIFSYILMILSFLVCYYTYSRTGLLISISLIPIISYLRSGISSSLLNIYILIVLLYLSTFFIDFFQTTNVAKSDLTDLTSIYTRFVLLYLGFKLLISNLFLGVGPFSINHEMAQVVQNSFNDNIYLELLYLSDTMTLDTGYWISNPHFAILGAVLRYGFITLFIYIIILNMIRRSVNLIKYNKKIIIPITGLLIILFHNFMYPQLYWEFLFLFAATLIYYNNEIKNNLTKL